MFHSARLKLTAWYLLLIMALSILFSVVIYHEITREIERSFRTQQLRIYRLEHPDALFLSPDMISLPDSPVLQEAKNRIALILVLVNTGILVLAGGAGYFLAGRTLRPIQEMVDEQNRFITDASHELRTPLTALRSEIEVNLRDEKLTLNEAKQLLRSNLEEVEHLQFLSDNLLQLTQNQVPSSGLETVQISAIIEDALHIIQPLAKKKQITITKGEIAPTEVAGDKQNLIQLCVILLDNAVKYSAEKTTITIALRNDATSAYLSIIDQGIGIAKKDIPHIFDRFYRADTSRTKQWVAGYGLGLSIAKKIVDTHKGTMSVKSEKGKGTTFTVQLPF